MKIKKISFMIGIAILMMVILSSCTPVCPEPVCPEPVCPEPVCPEPACVECTPSIDCSIDCEVECETEVFIVCPDDVPGLIAAMNAANDESNYPGPNTITLLGGTYTLLEVNNEIGVGGSGDNGLPAVESEMMIEGNGSTITRDDNAPSFRILGVSGNGNLTLNDLNLSNGLTDENSDYSGFGGGALMIIFGGTATLNDTDVIDNTATKGGGGISNLGTLSMTGGSISNNTASGEGGGGGIINNGTLSLNSVLISNNTAGYGGGIFVNVGTVDIRNSTISGNNAISTGFNPGGGGIYARHTSTVTLDNTLLSENQAARKGCAIWNALGSVITIQNNTRFANNTCTEGGVAFNSSIINFNGAVIQSGNTTPYCTGGGTFNVGTGNTGDGSDLSCGF